MFNSAKAIDRGQMMFYGGNGTPMFELSQSRPLAALGSKMGKMAQMMQPEVVYREPLKKRFRKLLPKYNLELQAAKIRAEKRSLNKDIAVLPSKFLDEVGQAKFGSTKWKQALAAVPEISRLIDMTTSRKEKANIYNDMVYKNGNVDPAIKGYLRRLVNEFNYGDVIGPISKDVERQSELFRRTTGHDIQHSAHHLPMFHGTLNPRDFAQRLMAVSTLRRAVHRGYDADALARLTSGLLGNTDPQVTEDFANAFRNLDRADRYLDTHLTEEQRATLDQATRTPLPESVSRDRTPLPESVARSETPSLFRELTRGYAPLGSAAPEASSLSQSSISRSVSASPEDIGYLPLGSHRGPSMARSETPSLFRELTRGDVPSRHSSENPTTVRARPSSGIVAGSINPMTFTGATLPEHVQAYRGIDFTPNQDPEPSLNVGDQGQLTYTGLASGDAEDVEDLDENSARATSARNVGTEELNLADTDVTSALHVASAERGLPSNPVITAELEREDTPTDQPPSQPLDVSPPADHISPVEELDQSSANASLVASEALVHELEAGSAEPPAPSHTAAQPAAQPVAEQDDASEVMEPIDQQVPESSAASMAPIAVVASQEPPQLAVNQYTVPIESGKYSRSGAKGSHADEWNKKVDQLISEVQAEGADATMEHRHKKIIEADRARASEHQRILQRVKRDVLANHRKRIEEAKAHLSLRHPSLPQEAESLAEPLLPPSAAREVSSLLESAPEAPPERLLASGAAEPSAAEGEGLAQSGAHAALVRRKVPLLLKKKSTGSGLVQEPQALARGTAEYHLRHHQRIFTPTELEEVSNIRLDKDLLKVMEEYRNEYIKQLKDSVKLLELKNEIKTLSNKIRSGLSEEERKLVVETLDKTERQQKLVEKDIKDSRNYLQNHLKPKLLITGLKDKVPLHKQIIEVIKDNILLSGVKLPVKIDFLNFLTGKE